MVLLLLSAPRQAGGDPWYEKGGRLPCGYMWPVVSDLVSEIEASVYMTESDLGRRPPPRWSDAPSLYDCIPSDTTILAA